MVAIDVSTRIGADGRRYPAGEQPTDAADYRRTLVTSEHLAEQGTSGRSLAYAETAVQGAAVSATTLIAGLEITFEVTDRPVEVILDIPWVLVTAVATIPVGTIADEEGTAIRVAGAGLSGSSTTWLAQIVVRERITVPGTYTRRGYIGRGAGAGTVRVNSGLATTVASIEAIER